MRHILKPLLPALAASVLLAACGSSSSSSVSSTASSSNTGGTSNATVTTASSATLGKTILVDSQGMALYHLTAEAGGKFICTSSSCVAIWHPLTVSSGATPTSSVGSIGVVKRPDGTSQVTYNGMPLYTFAQDKAAGEANGQGIKDVGTWTTITVAGSTTGSTGGAAPAEPSSPSGY
jgi:predicted lipoprotein with Yx(FWY)xxD motif